MGYALSRRLSGAFFGWKVVAVAFTIAAFTFGIGYYGPSVFLKVLHQDRGWSLSTISSAITLHFLVSAVLVAYLPEAHRRLGIATVTQAGIVALALGIFCWSLATAPSYLFAAALLSGAGWSATSGAAIIAIVSPWFDRRRALALGHALNGASAGGIVFTPLWAVLIGMIGFQAAAGVVSSVTIIALSALVWRYLPPTPESLGLSPDGAYATSAAAPVERSAKSPARFIALIGQAKFATLSAAFALAMFAQIGVIAHLVTRLSPVIGTVSAAAFVSVATLSAIIGRLLAGALLGDHDRRLVAAANFSMQACGVGLLAFGSNAIMLVAGCILFGLGIGNLLLLPPLIAQREFAQVDVPRVVAMVTAANQAVFAFAPAVIGVLEEITGGYAAPFVFAAAVQIVAAAVVLAGRMDQPTT
jgi:predicted MFS family arabinose efflux permease